MSPTRQVEFADIHDRLTRSCRLVPHDATDALPILKALKRQGTVDTVFEVLTSSLVVPSSLLDVFEREVLLDSAEDRALWRSNKPELLRIANSFLVTVCHVYPTAGRCPPIVINLAHSVAWTSKSVSQASGACYREGNWELRYRHRDKHLYLRHSHKGPRTVIVDKPRRLKWKLPEGAWFDECCFAVRRSTASQYRDGRLDNACYSEKVSAVLKCNDTTHLLNDGIVPCLARDKYPLIQDGDVFRIDSRHGGVVVATTGIYNVFVYKVIYWYEEWFANRLIPRIAELVVAITPTGSVAYIATRRFDFPVPQAEDYHASLVTERMLQQWLNA